MLFCLFYVKSILDFSCERSWIFAWNSFLLPASKLAFFFLFLREINFWLYFEILQACPLQFRIFIICCYLWKIHNFCPILLINTFRNWSIHGKVYPWKYKLNWTKIVDFLLIALHFQDSKLGWTGLYQGKFCPRMQKKKDFQVTFFPFIFGRNWPCYFIFTTIG